MALWDRTIRLIFLLLLPPMLGCSKKPHPPNTIHLNFTYAPLSIDPRKSTDPITCVMNLMLYEGLMHLDPDGTVRRALAQEVQISADKKSYLFKLRPASWSDGTPITAYDFEMSWKGCIEPTFPSRSAHLFYVIKNGQAARGGECSIDEVGVRALDEKTLQVELEKPYPYFLELTAYPTYFPVPNQGLEVPYPQNGSIAITNGPFTLLSWKNDNEIVAVKNPYFWQEKSVKIDHIHISLIADEATALTLFDKGQLDFVGGLVSPLPLDAVATLKNSGKLYHHPIAGTTFCAFNTTHYPFHNRNIRKAFSLAVNRQSLIDNVIQMPEDVATEFVPPILKSKRALEHEGNQEELARIHFELGLEELGITKKEFPTVTYNYFSSELQKKLALALQNEWHRVLGINVILTSNELKTHFYKLSKRQFEFAQMSWIAQYFDQMNYLERLKYANCARNYSGWENSHFRALLEKSDCLDLSDRFRSLEKAEKIIMDEVPITPFYHYHLIYLQNPKLKNVEISPLGDIQFHNAYLLE